MTFQIKEHIIPSQHIRQHDDCSVQVGKAPRRLVLKQYSPTNYVPALGDITIIAAHGNGFVKELYEPLWEDLQTLLAEKGRRIRSIWIADTASQGASGLLNEDTKFDDVSWFDHSRDLLHLINHFRDEIVQPIVAIGHSMGASQLLMLSLAHPRLFSTLVLIEPIIAASSIQESGPGLVQMTLRRKTTWPTRQSAEKAFAKAFKTWDPRALQSLYNHALYPYPTSSSSNIEIPTRVVTGRYQELGGVVRPSYVYDGNFHPAEMPWVEEALVVHDLIPFVPCSAFYICGALSASSPADVRADWMARTGVGKDMGRPRQRLVEVTVVPDVGHLLPMEAPTACAKTAADWIDREVGEWEKEEKKLTGWRNAGQEEKMELAEKWMASLKAKF